MNLYANYIKERENADLIDTGKGFAKFKISGDECYIEDIYVLPEHRKTEEASRMADVVSDIARKRGCKFLTGSVCPQANNSTISMRVLLGYGFSLLKSDEKMIWFYKELR